MGKGEPMSFGMGFGTGWVRIAKFRPGQNPYPWAWITGQSIIYYFINNRGKPVAKVLKIFT
jgi:hypothetical protein